MCVTFQATYFLGGSSDDWNLKSMSFDKGEFLWQEMPGIITAWNTFILDKSRGFTQAGIERQNDSIMTYVWTILGAQAQTRTGILGMGTAFDAQKQFVSNADDAITLLLTSQERLSAMRMSFDSPALRSTLSLG